MGRKFKIQNKNDPKFLEAFQELMAGIIEALKFYCKL